MADDITLRANGRIDLTGDVRLDANDRVLLDAPDGVTVAPDEINDDWPYTLRGRTHVDLRAKGAGGSITVARSRIGSAVVELVTAAALSQVGEKQITVTDRSFLSTDPHETDLAATGRLFVDSTGPVTFSEGAEFDSGHTLVVRTRQLDDRLVLADGVRLEACRPVQNGTVDLRGVRGGVFDDGSTVVQGNILGAPGVMHQEACTS
jgi:hypothetical protein